MPGTIARLPDLEIPGDAPSQPDGGDALPGDRERAWARAGTGIWMVLRRVR